jgi:type IV pilus assembly protein PilY1
MISVKKTSRNFAASFCCALLGLAPVWADDTEIFFGNVQAGDVSPNVLFILDTSGSMSNTVPGTGLTRMQNMKQAMREILNGLNDVNVGIMRFSNPGGPVLYKVDYIDRNVNEATGELINVSSILLDNDDDAQQVIGTGAMFVNQPRLEMTVMSTGSGDTVTVDVSDGSDDAEEEVGGSGDNINRGDDDLEFTHKNGDSGREHVVGVRFQGVTVPPGATITNAYITFTMDNATDGPMELRITGEVKDTDAFTDVNNNISNRIDTTAYVDWNYSSSVASNQDLLTPDLSSIVQEIIGHTDWRGDGTEENDMVFMLARQPGSTVVGEYDVKSYNHSGGGEPVLTVEYTTGPSVAADALTGLRFQNVSVPMGVTITSATIDFTVGEADANETTNLVIYGEADDTPLPYSSSNKIDTRTRTTASVNWDAIPSWTNVDDIKSTPDLTSVVQEIVNMSDWCGGDDMAFIIAGDPSSFRSAWSRDANNGHQPVLNIQYQDDSVIPGATCMVATSSKRITSSADDVEEVGTTVYTSSPNLEWDGSTSVGLRFTNFKMPPGTTVSNAYLQFDPYNGWPGSGTYSIEVENTGDSAQFSSADGSVDDRTWHTTSVSWTESVTWSAATDERSADISSLLQLVANHADWVMGNDLAFRIRRTSGNERQVESYDHDPADAPLLVVTFEDDGTATEVRTVRDELLEVVDDLNTRGYTPIQDTLYEAALYYTGGEVDYGAYRGGPNDSGPHRYTRVSADNSMITDTFRVSRPGGCTEDDLGHTNCKNEVIVGHAGNNPTYATPIDDWCQTNSHIILLTDGQANRPHSDSKISTFIGGACDNTGLTETGEFCVKDLVRYLHEEDQSPLKETQRITTHTIGFNFSSQWLADVAAAGGGQYRTATQASDLADEITEILTAVLKTNSSFVAPVAAINQFNRLNHRNEIYFAVFRPDETPSWPGNLKKYRLRGSDNAVIDYSSTEGVSAINPDTGFFTDTAQSAWGGVVDGKEVHLSGANSKMPAYGSRNLYTYYSGSSSLTLSNTVNALTNSNTNLTKTMFNVTSMTDAQFDDHIDWIRGKDVDDEDSDGVTAENRYIIGDPLHSKPVAVTYGGTDANPDITIFFGSNSGFLHAVDSATGVERFGFLPEDTYPEQEILRTASQSQSHVYGLDGSVTPWVHDANGDGTISGTGEFVRLYFGMRRGGRNYYALDVTDRDNPKMMWTIEGGSGDFVELGQTWSQPILGSIDIDGTVTDVLYFAGGYDPDQDDTDLRATDDTGRAVFIVNAETGALIWSGGNGTDFTKDFDDMLYSIPADLSVVDVTNSGLDNMIFVGDMGGQVWRFDIKNGSALADLVTGGVIADLGVAANTNSALINRRFYHGPDAALLSDGNVTKLGLTFGSGYHAHPLSVEAEDRFYMILQDQVYSVPTTYTKLTESDLYDATDNDVGEGVSGALALLDAKEGWYFDLPHTGEKVLSTPLTFKGTVTFTTYEPNSNSVTSNCIPAAGVTRVYQVKMEDASPVNEWDDVSGLTEADRGELLQTSSIVDEPVIICTGAGCDMFVGAEKPPVGTPNTDRVVKTFWRKN